jgi:hypothetical protein
MGPSETRMLDRRKFGWILGQLDELQVLESKYPTSNIRVLVEPKFIFAIPCMYNNGAIAFS